MCLYLSECHMVDLAVPSVIMYIVPNTAHEN